MTKFRDELAWDAVEALSAVATDHEIADTLAVYMLASRPSHSRTITINHDPKTDRCPVTVHKSMAKSCSVTSTDQRWLREWMIKAFKLGFELTTSTQRGQETQSIKSVRQSIASRERMAIWRAGRAARIERGEDPDDGEIPF